MKWVGQHIWDFISRFRSDVYLEDISTGTIASGKNLGLDSNNKIVRNTITSGHDEVGSNGDNVSIKIARYVCGGAQPHSLFSSPRQIVAAQGSNKVILPVECYIVATDGPGAENVVDADLMLTYNGATDPAKAVRSLKSFMLGSKADQILVMPYADTFNVVGSSVGNVENRNLTLTSEANYTSNSIASIEVYVSYIVITNT
tara:strand:+ start:85 stop:687 length:603 start_codon:yes stop_codon:yes gene_type:complete